MSRLPRLDEATLKDNQRELYDKIARGPRGAVEGPLRVWLQSPGFAAHAQALGQYARYDSVLPPHLSELAILVTARYWSSGFEWSHHVPIGLKAGVPEQAVKAIGRAERLTFEDAQMQAVFDFVAELHVATKVGDVTYAAVKRALGVQGCVDLVGICGYYTLISMTINVFDVPNEHGPVLPELDMAVGDYFKV